MIMASEAACSTVAPEDIVLQKGRLQPGRMFLVDTEQGRIVDDEEIKRAITTERPYRQWLNDHLVHVNDLPAAPEVPAPGSRHAACNVRSRSATRSKTSA